MTNLRPLVLKIHIYYQIEPAQDMSGQDAAQSGRGYTAQVFFQKLPGLNNWKFVYAIFHKKHREVYWCYVNTFL